MKRLGLFLLISSLAFLYAEEDCFCINNPNDESCIPCEQTPEGCDDEGGEPGDTMSVILYD